MAAMCMGNPESLGVNRCFIMGACLPAASACSQESECCGAMAMPSPCAPKDGHYACLGAGACVPDGAPCTTRSDCCSVTSDCLLVGGALVCAPLIR